MAGVRTRLSNVCDIIEMSSCAIRGGKHVILTRSAWKKLHRNSAENEAWADLIRKSRQPDGNRTIMDKMPNGYIVYVGEHGHDGILDGESCPRKSVVLSLSSDGKDWEIEAIPIESLKGLFGEFYLVEGLRRKKGDEKWTNVQFDPDWYLTGFLSGRHQTWESMVIIGATATT